MALNEAYKIVGLDIELEVNISCECSEIIEDLNDDIIEFGCDQLCRVYKKYKDLYLIFYDYAIIGFDKMDDDPNFIEVTLEKAREIFKAQNSLI